MLIKKFKENSELLNSTDWGVYLQEEVEKAYFEDLLNFVASERKNYDVFPAKNEVFTALLLTSLASVKVVILGQDPYHDHGQAHGLSFSVKEGVKFPPSLRNIFTELKADLGIEIPKNGNLSSWAKQGVLLLNAVLTVRAHTPNSHKDKGWENFTDAIIRLISEQKEGVIFVLWGRYAQNKTALINQEKHLIIKSAHPSPLSADKGFFGSRPFSKINEYLRQAGQEEINWQLSDSLSKN